MADESIDWAGLEWVWGSDVRRKIDYWERLAQLEITEALKEGQFSETEIAYVAAAESRMVAIGEYDLRPMIGGSTNHRHRKCLLLAVLGRDPRSCIKSFMFKGNEHRLSEDEVLALCVNLSSNTKVEIVNLQFQKLFGKWQACALLGHALRGNSTVRELNLFDADMGSEAVKCLMGGLTHNKTLEVLDLRLNKFGDKGVASVAEMLRSSTSLKALRMYWVESTCEGAQVLSSALADNTSLEKLDFSSNHIQRDGMERILSVLVPMDESGGQGNKTLKSLKFNFMFEGDFSVQALAAVIRNNKTLSSLEIAAAPIDSKEWLDFIMPALKENHTLKKLSLRDCLGFSDDVFDVLMDILKSGGSSGLEKIDIADTPVWMRAGQINEELRINKEYRAVLSAHTQPVQPKSGRLVLCGYEYAGKTTLCRTMVRNREGTSRSDLWKMAWKNLVQKFPGVRVFLFGKNVLRELSERTRGLDIVIVSDDSPRILAWDFAGQKEFFALHDYMFPNFRNSCFLYVCNPSIVRNYKQTDPADRGHQVEMKERLLFWMKFILSNSKHDQERRLPTVYFIMTNKDKLQAKSLYLYTQWATHVVSELKEMFQGKIALCADVQVVNAQSREDVGRLLEVIKKTLVDLLRQSPEYSVCGQVREMLESWEKDNPSKPILRMADFQKIVAAKIPSMSPEIRDSVLAYLNDAGEIIFVKNLDFIVINPRWFGVGILGSMVKAFRGTEVLAGEWNGLCRCVSGTGNLGGLYHEHGFVSRQNIDNLLENSLKAVPHLTGDVSSSDLISLILQLELGFEETNGLDGSPLFVPAVFDDPEEKAVKGERKLEWHRQEIGACYIGRRLECEDDRTFLTPGFFPRLQVYLRNYLDKEKRWARNPGFRVDRNLIGFIEDDIEVMLEYSGSTGYFVDILVKFHPAFHSFPETLQFMEDNVVSRILNFCASPRGCQGVQLVEAVIRPICVEELHVCAERKYHSVLVSELQKRIQDYGEGSKHTWQKTIEGTEVSEVALMLLVGDPGLSLKTVQSWDMFTANQLEDQRVQLSGPTSQSTSTQTLEDFPRLFYATIEDVSTITRLSVKGNQILAKVLPINLHLMCADGRGRTHKVADQPGRLLKLNSKAGNNLPLIKLAVGVLWAGLRVSGTVVGVPAIQTDHIDNWVDNLFSVPQMNISSEDLVKYMHHRVGERTTTGQECSEDDILRALNRYLQLDPTTPWLKGFLNLQDHSKFLEDFRLYRVKYTQGPSNVGWLCEKCYFDGLHKGILHQV